MSSTNRVQVAIARSAEREIPTALTAMQLLRITGTPNLAFSPTNEISNEFRADRNVPDLIAVGAEAGGDIGFELSFQTFDLLFESILLTQFGAIAGTATVTKSGAVQITDIDAGDILVDDGTDFQVGQIGRLFGVDANNPDALRDGVYEITGIAVNTLSVIQHSGPATLLDLAGGDFTTATFKVVGIIAQANAEISAVAGAGVATLTFAGAAAAALPNSMGNGLPLNVGQWIKIGNSADPTQRFATAGDNVYARLSGVTATTLTFLAPTGFATDPGTTEQVAVYYGDHLPNPDAANIQPITSHQFAIERSYTDHPDISRELFLGMALNSLNLNLQPQSIVTGVGTFFGLNAKARPQSLISELYTSGSPTRSQAPLFNVYNTSSNVGRLGRGIDPVDAAGLNFVTEASIEINANLRRQPAVGVFGASGIGVGELSITGTLNAYFDNLDLLNAVLDGTDTSFDVAVRDNTGRAIIFDVPRVRFAGGAPDVPGKNQDVTIPLTYQGLLDANLGYSVSVQRLPFVG